MEAGRGRDEGESREMFGGLLADLETSVADACARQEEWPRRISAGIYAGVDYAIEHPEVVAALSVIGRVEVASLSGYTLTIERLAALISRDAPAGSRLPGSTDETLVAGVVGLVGDHIRVGRVEALEALRPDLVLLVLLPYLGFAGAQEWANKSGDAI